MRLRVINVQIATEDFGSSAGTTDALNELFGENADLIVDWAYPRGQDRVVEVDATSQEDYEEYSAFVEVRPAEQGDKDSLYGHVKALQIATQEGSVLSPDLQLEITREVVSYILSRLDRRVPNEGTTAALNELVDYATS